MYYRYYHYPQDHRVQPHYGVRTERHKLIYFNKINQWELFDLQKDPYELKNLYADPAHAETVKELKAEMYRLKKELKDEDQFEKELPKDNVGLRRLLPLTLRRLTASDCCASVRVRATQTRWRVHEFLGNRSDCA